MGLDLEQYIEMCQRENADREIANFESIRFM